MLEHIPTKQKVIDEIKYALKKEGTVLLSTPSKKAMDIWNILVEAPYRLVLKAKSITLGYDKPLYPNQLKQYLQEAGFNIERFELNVILPPKGVFIYLPKFLTHYFMRICDFIEKHYSKIFAPRFAMHMVVKVKKQSGVATKELERR